MVMRGLRFPLLFAFLLGLAVAVRAEDPKPPKPDEPKKEEKQDQAKPKEEPKPKEKEKEKEKKPKDKYLAIENAEVHPITGSVLSAATVLVKNGKIDQVGRDVKVPDDAKKIDAKGLKVYPGLIAINSNNIVGREPVMDNTDPFSLQITLALAGGITTVVTGDSAAKLTYGSLDGHLLRDNLFVRLNYAQTSASQRAKVRTDLKKAKDYLRAKAEYDKKKAEQQKEAPPQPQGQQPPQQEPRRGPGPPPKEEPKKDAPKK